MSVAIAGTQLKKMTHNGTTVKKWVHDGVQVYSAERVLLGEGVNLLGTPTYGALGTGFYGTYSAASLTPLADGTYQLALTKDTADWGNLYASFPNAVAPDGYSTLRLSCKVKSIGSYGQVWFYTPDAVMTGATQSDGRTNVYVYNMDAINDVGVSQSFAFDVTGKDQFYIGFGVQLQPGESATIIIESLRLE